MPRGGAARRGTPPSGGGGDAAARGSAPGSAGSEGHSGARPGFDLGGRGHATRLRVHWRGAKNERLFAIVNHLLTRGRTGARQLADRFEVSERTIYRDMDSLSGNGVPVIAVPALAAASRSRRPSASTGAS